MTGNEKSKSPADKFKEENAGATKEMERILNNVDEGGEGGDGTRPMDENSPMGKLAYFYAATPKTTSPSKVLFGMAGKKFTVADLRAMFEK